MISDIGTGVDNTPLMKHFHKHFPSHPHCSQYIRSTLHNPNKPSYKPLNTVKGLLKHKQMHIRSQVDTAVTLVSQRNKSQPAASTVKALHFLPFNKNAVKSLSGRVKLFSFLLPTGRIM